ncbi:MAG TPA: thrombospondin type 3 repeat-containing protein, partial [Thermoleophilaceae bacterium]
LGDACDSDDDADGVPDDQPDNCPVTPNADQANTDAVRGGGDAQGDACDADDDDDGDPDDADNCALVSNPNQEDNEPDGIGDACDPDDDNDGVPENGTPPDNCPLEQNADQMDTDLDTYGDVCDAEPLNPLAH